jgi:hypothetical protein
MSDQDLPVVSEGGRSTGYAGLWAACPGNAEPQLGMCHDSGLPNPGGRAELGLGVPRACRPEASVPSAAASFRHDR